MKRNKVTRKAKEELLCSGFSHYEWKIVEDREFTMVIENRKGRRRTIFKLKARSMKERGLI